jgi:TolB-like protein
MVEDRFAFGAFILDRQRGILLKDGAPVPLGHRGLALLVALAQAGGRVVSKADLMDAAWPRQEVEESNLSVQIAALRKLLGDGPAGEEWITTVPRIGYQLQTADAAPRREQGANALAPAPGPSIAVLPFTNLSDSREQEFIADGMTDDVISALSRVGELSVVSRSSSFALKGRGLRAREAAAELGVRYILEGSLRAAGGQMRVTAQLTDGHTGNAIWAERYDGTADALFTFQDDLTRNIVQALQVTLTKGESARLWEGQTRNLRAWEKAVQGHQTFLRYNTADNAAGRRLLEEAVALDPGYTGALAWLGITHYWDARYSLTVDREGAIDRLQHCTDAMEALNPGLSQLFMLKSCAAFLKRHYDDALGWGREATLRAPGDSRAHGFLGMFQIYAGDIDGALVSVTQAMQRSPRPEVYLHYYLGMIQMWRGELGKALEHALDNQRQRDPSPYAASLIAAIRGLRGEQAEARAAVAALREATPSFGIRNIRHSELYRDEGHLTRLATILAAVGLPD